MYRLYIDTYCFYFDTLEEACEHLCKILRALNLTWFYDKGKFIETSFPRKLKKVKIYELETATPHIKFKIHYKGKEPLLSELVMYYLNKHI